MDGSFQEKIVYVSSAHETQESGKTENSIETTTQKDLRQGIHLLVPLLGVARGADQGTQRDGLPIAQ